MTRQNDTKPTRAAYWKGIAVEAARDMFTTALGGAIVVCMLLFSIITAILVSLDAPFSAGEWVAIVIAPFLIVYALGVSIVHAVNKGY